MSWEAYLHARQLWIETGDLDALALMISNVTERDGPVPDRLAPIAWRTPAGPELLAVTPDDLRCY